MIVRGGTAGNEILNGFYFKRLDTYGLPQYELRRKENTGGARGSWLYKLEDKAGMWVLGARPQDQLPVTLAGLRRGPK